MTEDANEQLMDEDRRIAHLRILRVLSAMVWCAGGVILLFKGGKLLLTSIPLFPTSQWPWVAAVGALALGVIKGKLLFSKTCLKNLNRISNLKRPRIWQFFSPVFFLLLFFMITAGVILSRLAHTSFPALVGAAFIDLAVGSALLASSRVFWQQRAFAKSRPSVC